MKLSVFSWRRALVMLALTLGGCRIAVPSDEETVGEDLITTFPRWYLLEGEQGLPALVDNPEAEASGRIHGDVTEAKVQLPYRSAKAIAKALQAFDADCSGTLLAGSVGPVVVLERFRGAYLVTIAHDQQTTTASWTFGANEECDKYYLIKPSDLKIIGIFPVE